MEFFEALNLTAIPRELNSEVDELVVAASTLQPSENLAKEEIKMEIIFRPSAPGNVDHWQVFDDDKQVINFLNNLHEFADFKVDCKEEGRYYLECDPQVNPTSRNIVALEQLFDKHDGQKKERKENLNPGDHIEVNI